MWHNFGSRFLGLWPWLPRRFLRRGSFKSSSKNAGWLRYHQSRFNGAVLIVQCRMCHRLPIWKWQTELLEKQVIIVSKGITKSIFSIENKDLHLMGILRGLFSKVWIWGLSIKSTSSSKCSYRIWAYLAGAGTLSQFRGNPSIRKSVFPSFCPFCIAWRHQGFHWKALPS